MKTRYFGAVFACSLLGLVGCASGPEVHADLDPTVDFTQYKTFAYASPLGTDRNGYQTIVSQHLKLATQRELETRGLRLVDTSPQLLVNFNGRVSEKLRVDNFAAPIAMPYYGYRYGFYAGWPQYVNEQRVSTYTEGTLNIDLIDAARKQLVWEGTVVGAISQRTMTDVRPAIDSAVAAAFSKYPVKQPVFTK
jgi:hypothetical protein